MSKKIIILFFLFFSLLSYKAFASEADRVNTDSEDFETTTIEDEIYDPRGSYISSSIVVVSKSSESVFTRSASLANAL